MEASNRTLLTVLRKRIHFAKGKWVEELHGVLWVYRITSRKPTGVSPFTLTYGMEAIIPTEIEMPTLRTEIPEEANVEALARNLDIIEELREAAVVLMSSYQQRTTNLYNRQVRQCAYQAEDLVLRKVYENTIDLTTYKFQPNWESPYTIVRVGLAGSYALDKMDEYVSARDVECCAS